MDFRFTEEQRIWHDTLHDFMENEVGREYTREHDASREFPYEVYRKMADQGWLGLLLPEEDGGAAADPVMFAIFCEAIAKFSLDTAACIMTRCSRPRISRVTGHRSKGRRICRLSCVAKRRSPSRSANRVLAPTPPPPGPRRRSMAMSGC